MKFQIAIIGFLTVVLALQERTQHLEITAGRGTHKNMPNYNFTTWDETLLNILHISEVVHPKLHQITRNFLSFVTSGKSSMVEVENQLNLQQYCEAYMGTPLQKMKFAIDTGQCMVWLYEQNGCTQSMIGCPNKPKFQSSKSSNYHPIGVSTQLSYATQVINDVGVVEGPIVEDKFCFDDSKAEDKCIKDDNLKWLAVEEATLMEYYESSGFIGLAKISPFVGVPSFLEQIKAQKSGGLKPLFSMYLTSNPFYKGSLIFGDYQLDRYAKQGLNESDIKWFNTISNSPNWNISMGTVRWSHQPQNLNISSKYLVIDSLRPFGLLPFNDMVQVGAFLLIGRRAEFYESDQWKGFVEYKFHPLDYESLPVLEINLKISNESSATKTIKMTKEQYLYPLEGGRYLFTFQGQEAYDGQWIIGQHFLREHYTIFDLENERVGFIEANPDAGIIHFSKILLKVLIYVVVISFWIVFGCCLVCCVFGLVCGRQKKQKVDYKTLNKQNQAERMLEYRNHFRDKKQQRSRGVSPRRGNLSKATQVTNTINQSLCNDV